MRWDESLPESWEDAPRDPPEAEVEHPVKFFELAGEFVLRPQYSVESGTRYSHSLRAAELAEVDDLEERPSDTTPENA